MEKLTHFYHHCTQYTLPITRLHILKSNIMLCALFLKLKSFFLKDTWQYTDKLERDQNWNYWTVESSHAPKMESDLKQCEKHHFSFPKLMTSATNITEENAITMNKIARQMVHYKCEFLTDAIKYHLNFSRNEHQKTGFKSLAILR